MKTAQKPGSAGVPPARSHSPKPQPAASESLPSERQPPAGDFVPWERRRPAGEFVPRERRRPAGLFPASLAPASRRRLEFGNSSCAPNRDAEGVTHISPGQRPGNLPLDVNRRPKACLISGFWASHRRIPSPASRSRAFTMIEIAISLAIIGFALVAIVGILPIAMNAQRDNRQETIINQDASILIDAVRNGERGLDDLTNYVVAITNYIRDYSQVGAPVSFNVLGYTVQGSTFNGSPSNPQYPLTNGYSIIGLLSTPKILVHPSGRGFSSNHVVAVFRSMSGPASEKPPQVNPTMQDLALSYRVIADVSAYGTNFFYPGWTNFNISGLSTNDIASRSNYMILVQTLQTNVHDLRLTFLWPFLPSGKLGSGRQVYRTMVAGHYTNDPPSTPFFFFQPRTYF